LIRRLFIAVAIALVWSATPVSAPLAGAKPASTPITVADYGVYTLSVKKRVKAPGDVSGERNVVTNIRLQERTRTVFGQLGRSFGYRFRIADPTLFGRQLTLRTIFPTLRDPRTGRSGTSQSRPFIALSSGLYYDGYRFDFSWEMAEGLWRFQLLDGGKLLHEETLRVVIPLN